MKKKATLRTCENNHQFYKSSDCPTCPICEENRKPTDGFLSMLTAPARRALENEGVRTVKQLSSYTEKEILALHGMGKSSIPKLKKALSEKSLMFKGDLI